MPINFPSSPSNNQLFVTEGKAMRYNATKNRWKAVSTLSSSQITDLENRTVGVSSMSISGNTLVIQKDDSSYANVSLASFAGNKLTTYANASILPLSDLVSGTQVYVEDTDSLYITDGSGWYKIATVNLSPSLTLGVSSISLSSGGSVDVNYTVNEPEDTPYTVTASSTSNATITVYQANNTITFDTPVAATTETITITATGGVNSVSDTLTMTIVLASWTNPIIQTFTSNGQYGSINKNNSHLGAGKATSLRGRGSSTQSSGSEVIGESQKGIAIKGDKLIIGHGNYLSNSEVAYIYERTGSTWSSPVTLSANLFTSVTTGNSYSFGYSVDIDGDYAVVGAPSAKSSQNTTDGRVYVFHKSGGTWGPHEMIEPLTRGSYGPAPNIGGQMSANNNLHTYGMNLRSFGRSVKINGDFIAVGSPLEDVSYTGSTFTDMGAVRLYQRSGTTWNLVGHVQGGGGGLKFGNAIAFSNNYLISNYAFAQGRVYAWKYNNSNGQISQANSHYIRDFSLNSQAYFGRSLDVSESYYDWLIVGVAAQEPSSQNTNENKVYVLRSNSGHGKWGVPDANKISDFGGSNTSNVTIITAPNAGSVDSNFGCQVAIQGHANGGATALIGAQTDEDSGTQKGAVYIYQTTTQGGGWTYIDRIVGASANDFFGSGVALSNTTAAIAAPGVDVTIGGTTYTNSGEAYVYEGDLPSGE